MYIHITRCFVSLNYFINRHNKVRAVIRLMYIIIAIMWWHYYYYYYRSIASRIINNAYIIYNIRGRNSVTPVHSRPSVRRRLCRGSSIRFRNSTTVILLLCLFTRNHSKTIMHSRTVGTVKIIPYAYTYTYVSSSYA